MGIPPCVDFIQLSYPAEGVTILRIDDTALCQRQAVINGDWTDVKSGENLALYDPATVDVVGTVAWMKV